MNSILYTYKFRIYPNSNQIDKLSKSFGCVRYVYNYFLNKEKENYKINHNHLGYYNNAKELTSLKKELIWLKDCNSQSLQASLKHLERAYKNFFNKNIDFNASINILNEGLRSLSLGTNDYTDGANILSPTMVSEPIFSYLGELAMKSEATKSLV